MQHLLLKSRQAIGAVPWLWIREVRPLQIGVAHLPVLFLPLKIGMGPRVMFFTHHQTIASHPPGMIHDGRRRDP